MKATSCLLAVLATFAPFAQSVAQEPASEHDGHHPGTAPVPTLSEPAKPISPVAPPTSLAGPPGGEMAGMGDMMKGMMSPASGGVGCCGVAGGKPFYPTMMNLPVLTDATRKAIRTEAVARLGLGAAAISAGQVDLHHAQASNDLVAAQAAINAVSDGVSLAESGNSALQGLNQSQPPPRIAQTWFKREMSVTPDSDMVMGGGFRDLSWLHLATMLLLAAALVAALLLRWARLQRIGTLAERLTPGGQPLGVSPAAEAKPADAAKSKPAGPPAQPPPVKRPWKGVLRIKAIFDETPTVKTFRLMEPNMGSIPFSFLPGQYASITSEIDGKKVRRSYTIASSPTQRDYIELTVVRRQNIRHNSRRRLAECGPRQGVDVRRRTCGAASADDRWSVA